MSRRRAGCTAFGAIEPLGRRQLDRSAMPSRRKLIRIAGGITDRPATSPSLARGGVIPPRLSDTSRLGDLCGPPRDGQTQIRTGDTTIFSRVLYQLSYLAAARELSRSPAVTFALVVRQFDALPSRSRRPYARPSAPDRRHMRARRCPTHVRESANVPPYARERERPAVRGRAPSHRAARRSLRALRARALTGPTLSELGTR